MPNYVQNRLEFFGNPQQIQDILERIKSEKYGIGTMDFNKIIPRPESLDIEAGSKTYRGLEAYKGFIALYIHGRDAADALRALENIPLESEELFLRQRTDIRRDEWELGKTAWQNMQKYGAPTWYEWSTRNWGTKWNACGYEEGVDYSGCADFGFETAWSAPHPVLQELSEMYPDVTIEHQWADEAIGTNCGKREYLGGEVIDEFFPEGIRAAEFAMEVWEYTPAELGLAKNSTGTAYVNIEDEGYLSMELFGKPALFSHCQVMPEDIPEGLYCYDLRCSDDNQTFIAIEPTAEMNFGGTVITKEPLDFGTQGYIALTEGNEPVLSEDAFSLAEYMRGGLGQENTQQFGGMQL